MSEVIRQWLQRKLGIIINLRPETFCDVTRDGILIGRILRSYEIVNEEQFKMINKSDNKEVCLKNFQLHIANWLKIINIHLKNDEITDIVENRGLASLSLFYRLFLELHEKDCLTYVTENRLKEKFRPQLSNFTVVKVKDNTFEKLHNVDNIYKEHMDNTYELMHWLQDRFEMVVGRCKTAREEYLSLVRNSKRKLSSSFALPLKIFTCEPCEIDSISQKTEDLTYQELIEETRKCKTTPLQPNSQEATNILEKIRTKLKHKAENEIFRKELELYLKKYFWNRIIVAESEDFHTDVTRKVLKQSLFEKQMIGKLLEIKEQKEDILKTKNIVIDEIFKQKEAIFLNKLFEKDEAIDRRHLRYYIERERANQLHTALYTQIQRLKEQRRLEVCQDTVEGICDMAIKYSEYRAFFGEAPSKLITDSWNKKIITGQSLDEPEIPVKELIDGTSEKPEKIIHKEIEKQDIIDKKDFEIYSFFEWPWLLTSIDVEDELIDEMNCGMNVLGHIVQLLLKEKYQLPPLTVPPDLPKVHTRVCVNGVPDTTYLPLLRKLLEHKKILVVELQDAVNYGISAFEKESAVDAHDAIKEEEIDEKPKKEKKVKGKKAKAKNKPKEATQLDGVVQVETENKSIQTPTVYPCEQVILSQPAELGKVAAEELSNGAHLTDYLLVSMFVEYLKAKTDIEGWVLINYPTNFEQAVLLEEGLSGLQVPGIRGSTRICKSLIDIVYICEPDDILINDQPFKKSSALVTDPALPTEPPPYDSILTAYINICFDLDEELSESEEPSSSEDNQGSGDLDKFYTDMGCHYSLYFKTFDYSTIKQLGKLIIGEYSLPPKSSIELFGDTVRYIEAEKLVDYRNSKYLKSGEKVERERIEKVKKSSTVITSVAETEDSSKKGKKSKSDKKGKKSKSRSRIIIVHEDKSTQIPETTIVIEEQEEEEGEVKPGEPGWRYLNLLVTDRVRSIITDFWEHLEEVYVNDMTQVFFLKKSLMNIVMPYTNYIKRFMEKHIIKPDERQIYLLKFQENFNQFDSDFRQDSDFKAELHCLVNELKQKLFDLSDKKMMEAEQERQYLIEQSWGPRQVIEIVNNYISAIQLELDRHFDSLMFINDYFTGLVTQTLGEDRLIKEILPKFELEDQAIHKMINKHLTQTNEDNTDHIRHFKDKIDNICNVALTNAQKRRQIALAWFDRIKLLFHPEVTKGKAKGKTKKGAKGTKTILNIFEPSELIKRNQGQIIDEWLCALKGEVARFEIRLLLIKHDMFENVDTFVRTIKKTFDTLFDDIKTRYFKEMECIKKACYVFDYAIEKEVPIEEELLFVDDELLMDPDVLLYKPVEKLESQEVSNEFYFTLSQLHQVMDIFFDLASQGFIPHTTFKFLLQDIVASEVESLVPNQWKRLYGFQVNQLSHKLFDNQKYVHWKDFIIYNLSIPIPNDEEIVDLRYQFLNCDPERTELISLDNFQNIRFWFEKEISDSNELDFCKQLLFRMYQFNQYSCNYTALLLDFCKGECVQEGLAKALAVIYGKPVCWNVEIGTFYVEEILTKHANHQVAVELREEEIRDNKEFVGTIIDSIIDKTVHVCDSVVITEIFSKEDVQDLETFERQEDTINETNEQHRRESENISLNRSITEDLNDNIIDRVETAENEQKQIVGEQPLIDQNVDDHDDDLEQESKDDDDLLYQNVAAGLVQKSFSNIAIGFEPQISPNMKYFLLFEDISTILFQTLSDVLSSKDKQFFDIICDIFDECRNSNFNGNVLCHEFLNNKRFLELMADKPKFIVKNAAKLVETILTNYEIKPPCK